MAGGKSMDDVLLDRARGHVISKLDPVSGGVHCALGNGRYLLPLRPFPRRRRRRRRLPACLPVVSLSGEHMRASSGARSPGELLREPPGGLTSSGNR